MKIKPVLRTLPNGVKDELTVKRISNEITLSGSEDWVIHPTINDLFLCTNAVSNVKRTNDAILSCNILTPTTYYPTANSSISMGGDSSGGPNRVLIKLTDYANNLTGFKQWLTENKPVIFYQLEVSRVNMSKFMY